MTADVFGLTADGFVPKTLQVLKTELEDRWRTEFGQNADVSAESPDGQLIGIMAERLASVWEQLLAVYQAGNVGSAIGAALDEKAALAGITRREAQASTVTVTLHGTNGTVVPAGTVIRIADTLTRWTLATGTIGVGGTVDVLATAEETGVIQALSGSTWEIVNAVTGLTSVTNALDADLGSDRETDSILRQRIRRDQQAVSPVLNAIRKAVENLDGVFEVEVFENALDFEDAEGRPPHSFEVIVRGGDSTEIAESIWALKADGIRTYGLTSANVTDALGQIVPVYFTRPSDVDVYVTAEITADSAFPADGVAQVEAAILAYESKVRTGADIVGFKIVQAIDVEGIHDLTLYLGTSANPSLSLPISIGDREIAAFDSSRIVASVVANV